MGQLNNFNNWMESDQTQRLVWDTASSNTGGDTLLKLRVRIKYRFYYGQYAYGADPLKPIRCIKLDTVIAYRKTATATGYNGGTVNVIDLIDKPSFEARAPSGDDIWCWGGALSLDPRGPSCDRTNAASVLIRVKFPWRRACDLENDNGIGGWGNGSATADTFQTGGLVGPNVTMWGGGPPLQWVQNNSYTSDANQWEVQIFARQPTSPNAGGWWTVNNYGANNSPYTDGWRNTGPPLYIVGKPGYAMCPRYKYSFNDVLTHGIDGPQFYFNFHGGPTHYETPVTGW
jgi:hypothetical protein